MLNIADNSIYNYTQISRIQLQFVCSYLFNKSTHVLFFDRVRKKKRIRVVTKQFLAVCGCVIQGQ